MVKEPIDAEKLGAVLDGTAGQERDALLARLAADEDDYAVFAETAAVLREIEDEAESVAPATAVAPEIMAEAEAAVPIAEVPAAPPARELPAAEVARDPVISAKPTETARALEPDGVIRLRPRRSVWTSPATRWLAAAAVLVAVAVPVMRLRGGADAWRDSRKVVALASVETLPSDREMTRPWIRVRGVDTDAPRRGASAKVGTLHADLEVVANARGPRDAAAVRDLASQAAGAAKSINETGVEEVEAEYRSVESSATASRSQLLSDLNAAGQAATQFLDPDYFALGAWTEAARFAASERTAKFFSPRNTRRPLERAEALEGLSNEARDAVRAIRSAVEQQGGIRDWNALSGHLLTLHKGLVRQVDPERAYLP